MDVKMLEMRLKQKEDAGVFRKDEYAKNLASQFLEKARHNLVCMRTSYDISTNPVLKSAASLPKDFNEFDWAVIKAYYAMYHSGLACLAKIGYKSDDHNASILALELFFVHKGLLERRYLQLMEKVMVLEDAFVKKILFAKKARRIAQYGVGEQTERLTAEETMKDAGEFVQRMARLFDEIKT